MNEDVLAIAASLRDLDDGVEGQELEVFIDEFCKRHGLSEVDGKEEHS